MAQMPDTRNLRAGMCLAGIALLALPASAQARTAIAELRVEGARKTLEPGTGYVTGTERLPAATDRGCNRTAKRFRVAEPTAMGLLGSAAETNPLLRPLGVANDEFGLRVCRIGGFVETDDPFTGWLYRVNHVAPPRSAALRQLGGGDEVLWVFANFGTGRNTGDELVIRAPVRTRPGKLQVRVIAIKFDGTRRPAPDGTKVRGGTEPVRTDGGVATLQVAGRGTLGLRATHGDDIPSQTVAVCVDPQLARCPRHRGQQIVGSTGPDRIPGTPGPDRIEARAGADRVNVRGGGPDVVACGTGRDVALIDAADRVGSSCEVIRRR